jgi:putative tryptophan/tyrosine transport system substrate-binding protein
VRVVRQARSRWLVLFAVVVGAGALVACGDDGDATRTIAFLRIVPTAADDQQAFLDELADAGWKVGDNVTVLEPDVDDVHADEADAAQTVEGWVDDGVDLIVALSTASATVASEHAGNVPVVSLANDPVGSGLVHEPRAPEGNLTGTSFRVPGDRTIDLATRLAPGAPAVGVLWPEDDPAAVPVREALVVAATALHVPLASELFRGADDVGAAIGRIQSAGAGVVVLVSAPATTRAYDAIEEAADAAHLPIVANSVSVPFATLVLAPDTDTVYRQLGRQAARLLDGTEVRRVPVEDPGMFTLELRRNHAQRLGIELPADLLDEADRIVD